MESRNNMAPGPLKPRVLALVAQGMAEQQAFIEHLTDAERGAIGEFDKWSSKDHVAHNAAWLADAARVIGAAARGEAPAPGPEETELNSRVFKEYQHQPWDVVLAGASRAGEALSAALDACSEADLSDPARFPWRQGRPLWFEAYVSGYEHPVEHYGHFYLQSGEYARAGAVRKEAVETARRLIGETEPYGFMVYNLGCFYTKAGQRDLALPAIREALARVPRLRKWSHEDPDLAPLHDDPAFQTLITGSADIEGATSTA